MAWVTWVKNTLWNNNQIGKIGQGTLKFTFNTVANLFDQIGKLPRVAYSLTYHQPSRQITNSLNYIVIHDLLPMILVNSINTLLQDAYRSENEEEQGYFSSAYFLSSALATLHYAVNLYTVRQGLQMTTRTMLVALSAPDAFNQINPRPK